MDEKSSKLSEKNWYLSIYKFVMNEQTPSTDEQNVISPKAPEQLFSFLLLYKIFSDGISMTSIKNVEPEAICWVVFCTIACYVHNEL